MAYLNTCARCGDKYNYYHPITRCDDRVRARANRVSGARAELKTAFTAPDGRPATEKKDCVVRAIAFALNITYAEAHAICKANGRRDGDGMFDYQWEPILRKNGFVNELADGRKGWGARVVKTFVTRVATSGRWVLKVRGHAFAVVDGVPLDLVSAKGLANRRVQAAWRLQ